MVTAARCVASRFEYELHTESARDFDAATNWTETVTEAEAVTEAETEAVTEAETEAEAEVLAEAGPLVAPPTMSSFGV